MTPSICFPVVSVRYLLLALLPVNIVGNSIVFVIFLKKKATRQFFNLLLLNLATADLLFGIVVLICGLAFRLAGTAVNDFSVRLLAESFTFLAEYLCSHW